MARKAKVIGITGGIASGKSTLAEMLGSLGANVINADKICHQLINTGKISQQIIDRWGNQIQDKDGKIDRQALGKIVFTNKRELSALNRIVHPDAIERIKNQITRLRENTATKAIVLDAALLVESNLTDLCDIILYIETKKITCNTRARNSRKWSLDEITKRERFQGALRVKRKLADVVINNNRSLADTFKQAKVFWHQFITKK